MFFVPKNFQPNLPTRFKTISSFFARVEKDYGYRRKVFLKAFSKRPTFLRDPKKLFHIKLWNLRKKGFYPRLFTRFTSPTSSYISFHNMNLNYKQYIFDKTSKFQKRPSYRFRSPFYYGNMDSEWTLTAKRKQFDSPYRFVISWPDGIDPRSPRALIAKLNAAKLKSQSKAKSKPVKPTKSKPVKPTKSKPVKPTKSKLVKPTKSKLVKPTKSKLVKPTKSKLVKPQYRSSAKRVSLYRKSRKPQRPSPNLQPFSFNLPLRPKSKLFYARKVKRFLFARYSPFTRNRRPKRISFTPFNRLWQKLYLNKFKKQLTFRAPPVKSFFKRVAALARYRGQNLPKRDLGKYLVNQLFGQLAFFLVQVGFSPNFKFSNFLVYSGFVSVNGVIIFSPSFKVKKHDLIKLNLTPSLFFTVYYVFLKLTNNSTLLNKPFAFFKRFQAPVFAEVSFKLLEALVVSELSQDSMRLEFINFYFNFGELLLQRFFIKQKRFGMGRLI